MVVFVSRAASRSFVRRADRKSSHRGRECATVRRRRATLAPITSTSQHRARRTGKQRKQNRPRDTTRTRDFHEPSTGYSDLALDLASDISGGDGPEHRSTRWASRHTRVGLGPRPFTRDRPSIGRLDLEQNLYARVTRAGQLVMIGTCGACQALTPPTPIPVPGSSSPKPRLVLLELLRAPALP